jgi:hypothetical protein
MENIVEIPQKIKSKNYKQASIPTSGYLC